MSTLMVGAVNLTRVALEVGEVTLTSIMLK
jgi:hypothetical protein